MKNVEMEIKGNKLIITADLTKDFGPSKSQKTTIIATTEGPATIPGHDKIKLGLNLYKTK